MTLRLYFHPLASFCWKALIALYETAAPFEPMVVDLGNAEQREAFFKIAPTGKFPLLVDTARGKTIFESDAVIAYLDAFYPGPNTLTPTDPDAAWQARQWSSFFDAYLHIPMQNIVADTFRPADGKDALGVAAAHEAIRKAYATLETAFADKRAWAAGAEFTFAECAAVPALFYADCVEPLPEEHRVVAAYMDRLRARPSVRRTLEAAAPYFPMFPIARKPRI